MRLVGKIFKAGRYWAIEVPILGVVTQGRTKSEAYKMIKDAIESLVNKNTFTVEVFPGDAGQFEIDSGDQAALMAFLLRRQRLQQGVSLAAVAERLGTRSPNAYARYEQGTAVPSVEKFAKLLAAVAPNANFVLDLRRNQAAPQRER